MKTLVKKAKHELTGNILPFWMNKATDNEFGGFFGQIDGRGKVIKEADKGGIVNARILWTFSAAYSLLNDPLYLNAALKSRDYIFSHFFDEQYQGTYWKITFDGKPSDTKKQIYSQAFFLYALAEFYKSSNDIKSLEKAISLFYLIEDKSFDKEFNGYFEAYSKDWKLLDDLRLSTKDANEKKTTNTHLHILEAYANLYKVWKEPYLEKQLRNLVKIFFDKIIDKQTNHLLLFFDEFWNSRSTLISYGHDIEASWLIFDAALALADPALIEQAKPLCTALGMAALEGLQSDGSLIYERDNIHGIIDMDRHWWPQAETVIGLIHLYQLTGDNKFTEMAGKCWTYIENNLIDKVNGEWFWSIKADGTVNLLDDKAGFWKCPYHNARACMEVIKRLGKE